MRDEIDSFEHMPNENYISITGKAKLLRDAIVIFNDRKFYRMRMRNLDLYFLKLHRQR